MTLNVDSGDIIDLNAAKAYVKAFRLKYPNEVKGFFIGANNVQKILSQTDCIGLRIYSGYDTVEDRMNLVFLGVDKNENDMTDGVIMERVLTCPPICNGISPLN